MILYSEKEIIQQMRDHYEKNGKITMKSFSKDKDTCGITAVKKCFGSWIEAKIKADLSPKYDKKIIKKLIKEKVNSGELKSISAIDSVKGLPSYKYIKKIRSKDEIEKIFDIKVKRHSYSREEIMEAYNEVKHNHKVVTLLLMKEEKGISAGSIRRYFKSWNSFLVYMGDEPCHTITNVTHTNEELMSLYRKFSLKIGKEKYGATLRDLKNYDFPYSKSVLASRFTSINNLRRLTGFEIKKEVIPKYNKQGLKLLLYRNYKKYGRRLSQTEIAKDNSLPNPSSIFYCFQTTKITEVWDEVLNRK